jgi:hypothetical protein
MYVSFQTGTRRTVSGIRSRIYFKCSISPILPKAQQPLEGMGFLIIEATRPQSLNTPHSVGVLWTSDQPEAETSTWQNTTLTRDRPRCPLTGFELTVPVTESLQTHALDSTVTGIELSCTMIWTNDAQWPVTSTSLLKASLMIYEFNWKTKILILYIAKFH